MQNLYPSNLEDLLRTDLQIKIYEYVMNQTGVFNPRDVVEGLERQGISIPLGYVQKYLRALNLRNQINSFLHRERKRRGRSCIFYKTKKSFGVIKTAGNKKGT